MTDANLCADVARALVLDVETRRIEFSGGDGLTVCVDTCEYPNPGDWLLTECQFTPDLDGRSFSTALVRVYDLGWTHIHFKPMTGSDAVACILKTSDKQRIAQGTGATMAKALCRAIVATKGAA